MERVQVPAQDDANARTAEEERNLEAGVPSVGTFEVEEALAAQEAPAADAAVRTPRPELLKTEELLAPLDFVPSRSPPGHGHNPSASDATAVSVSPSAAKAPTTPPIWTPGTYVLLNARTGAALDLSGADNRTAIGYALHGGANQQWEFVPAGRGHVVRCVRRGADGRALYLALEEGRAAGKGAGVVAGEFPVVWAVEAGEDGIR